MKFAVLALDYDGTIARDGALDPEVRSAIADVRARGIAVVLVTGRILEELKQVTGGLGFVDAVVAENGAVLDFSGGNSRLIGHPTQPLFLEELRRRGIEFKAGQCVVETDAAWATQVLAVIRELELPLTLVFNRGRLMLLPQAISKGTGLREALTMLRLSPHNAIAIGDAENDHDLLTACEFGVAVGWGSRVLQKRARTQRSLEMARDLALWPDLYEKRPVVRRGCPLSASIEPALYWGRGTTDILSHWQCAAAIL